MSVLLELYAERDGALVFAGSAGRQLPLADIPKESKEQPKKVKLSLTVLTINGAMSPSITNHSLKTTT